MAMASNVTNRPSFSVPFHSFYCGIQTLEQRVLSLFPAASSSSSINHEMKGLIANLRDRGHDFLASTLNKLLEALVIKYGDRLAVTPAGGLFEQKEFKQFWTIPCIVKGVLGNHITVLIVEKIHPQAEGSKQEVKVEFFDGKALPIQHPLNENAKTMLDELTEFFTIKSYSELSRPVQFDGHNCGALVLRRIEERLNEGVIGFRSEVDIEKFRVRDLLQLLVQTGIIKTETIDDDWVDLKPEEKDADNIQQIVKNEFIVLGDN
jgi:hypothetical protein